MKRTILKLSTVLSIISACGQHSTVSKNAESSKVVAADSTIASTNTIPPQDNLTIVRQFAEHFVPDTTMQGGMRKMNHFPDSVVNAFKATRVDFQNQEKYLTLIYLKIYRGHLQCCHQSYELRVKPNSIGIDSIADPLLFEYNLITRQFDNNKRTEMINSGIAYHWVERNRNLLLDNQIKREYRLIKTIQKNIKNGTYW